ncbi:hypothetical protein GCM10020331_081750 [Ectobacillus funiculus]
MQQAGEDGGPIATPILLTKKGMSARKVVGTVDTSEFAIAVAATVGFVISLGWETVNWMWVAALVIGGVIAAPIAAWIVRIVPPQLMGLLVGGFIILVNARTMVNTWVANASFHPYIYLLLVLGWGAAIIFGVRKMNQDVKRDFTSLIVDEEANKKYLRGVTFLLFLKHTDL